MRYTKSLWAMTLLVLAIFLGGCSLGQTIGGAVPNTGDTANDASAAQRFIPVIEGYTATDADSIVDAISAVGGGASAISGNLVITGVIAGVDGLIQCYQNVGAAAARVYVENDVGGLLQGETPSAGALAVINGSRLVNNFLPCTVGQQAEGFSAQAETPQPCGGSGSFLADGETLYYVYAATEPNLCAAFQSVFPQQSQ